MNYFPGGKSPWPSNYLLVEMLINSVWTSMSLAELSEDGVQIMRGGRSGGLKQDPGVLTFSLKDPTGKWSPRHPSSPYYGLIGRGTKIRVRVRNHGTGLYFTRFYGEVSSWQPAWTKKGGPSARVDVEASGIFRRLGQGQAIARSPYRRSTEGLAGLFAYWPMEDASGSTFFGSTGDAGPIESTITGIQAAASASLQGSDALPEINGGQARGNVQTYTQGTTLQLRAIIKNSSATPASTPFLRYNFVGGTLGYIDCIYVNATTLTLNAYRADGTLIGGITTGFNTGANIYMHQINLTQSGGTLNYAERCLNYLNAVPGNNSSSWASTTMGRLRSVVINPTGVALGNSIVGHLSAATTINAATADEQYQTMNGYSGESALVRMIRLAGELGVSFTWTNGPWTSPRSENMGYQKSGVLLDIMQECADVDMGILRESTSSSNDLFYVTQGSMFSPRAADRSDFAYVENMFNPFVPVEDDAELRNQITVTRNVGGGGTATSVVEDGPLGVSTVGLYDDSISLNLDTPYSVRPQADWRVHLGTWDEARWPQIGVDLADSRIVGQQAFQEKVLNRDIGQVVNITGIPTWLPPFDVSQIITGVTEVIKTDSHKVIWDCIPARALRVGHWSEAVDRYSGDGTVTAGTLTTTATTFAISAPTGVVWTHADGDYDILINGERMTVKNVVAGVFTVVRSVNGVVKSHTMSSAITLYDPALWGL